MRLNIPLHGSLQNPSWSPDGRTIIFTRFADGYNNGHSGIYAVAVDAPDKPVRLVDDGHANVSQPGSCWSPASNRIIYSSDRAETDWPHSMNPNGSDQRALYGPKAGLMGYEPSWHSDGKSFAFEQHIEDQEGGGRIVMCHSDGLMMALTPPGVDCRQPCVSPNGQRIVYQRKTGATWNLWLLSTAFHESTQATRGIDATDATWHPYGTALLFSAEGGLWEAKLGGGMSRIRTGKYLGAPSWSPDGQRIACEAFDKDDPDDGPGTWIEIL